MKTKSTGDAIVLLVGDLLLLALSLWLSLWVRYLRVPSHVLFITHLKPFSLLFLVWIVGFYIAGLYDKRSLLRSKLLAVIANTQILNSLLAVAFFYLLPFYGIAPKTLLFIYIIVSFILLSVWRVYGSRMLVSKRQERAMIVGCGKEMEEIIGEVNGNAAYPFRFVSTIDLREAGTMLFDKIAGKVRDEGITYVVIDLSQNEVEPLMDRLYDMIFSNVTFVDLDELYESLFDRVPLSALKHSWFLENISTRPRVAYDALKRIMDVILSLPILAVTAVLVPFVALATKLEDGGPVFIRQERIGEKGRPIGVYKIRTMSVHKADSAEWTKHETDNKVTKAGAFLRRTSIDELPQVWNILKGELSFIGPRSDIKGLGMRLSEEIPYYSVRYLSKPGISGWAQVNQRYSPGNISPQSLEETKVRLAYDLYYVKHRSLLLDLQVALRTIKTLLSRVFNSNYR